MKEFGGPRSPKRAGEIRSNVRKRENPSMPGSDIILQ
jgi:hypothetical protein